MVAKRGHKAIPPNHLPLMTINFCNKYIIKMQLIGDYHHHLTGSFYIIVAMIILVVIVAVNPET